jgi:hypothetical protein
LTSGFAGSGSDTGIVTERPSGQAAVSDELVAVDGGANEQPAAPEETPAEQPTTGTISAGFDARPGRVPWWPFLVYELAWLVFAAVSIVRFSELPDGMAVYDSSSYSLMIYGGIALIILGALLSIAVWLLVRLQNGKGSEPIFARALMRGSSATLLGVALWWSALAYVDYVRLGEVF